VTSKYEYYNSLKTKLDKRNDDRWMRDFECGGMDFNRMGGRVNPGNLNPTCPRDGVTVTVTIDVDVRFYHVGATQLKKKFIFMTLTTLFSKKKY
jgi:hypothetical protein